MAVRVAVGPSVLGAIPNPTFIDNGQRLHQMALMNKEQRAIPQLFEMQAEQKAGAQQTTTSHTTASSETTAGTQGGADPWWLKDLPWFMPPPPEWGPLPPTMYQAYWERPLGAPLSTPNYGPLFRRVEDMEPPLGHGAPLKSPPTSDPQQAMQPPVEVHDAGNGPPAGGGASFIERGPPDSYSLPSSIFLQLDEKLDDTGAMGARSRLKRMLSKAQNARAAAASSSRTIASESTDAESSAQASSASNNSPFTTDSLTGPWTIAEHLLNSRQVIPVPPELRYDKRRLYRSYWENFKRDNPLPFSFKFSPEYPPSIGHALRGTVEKPGWKTPEHHYAPKYFPSKYDEPTLWQQAKMQEIGAQQDSLPPVSPPSDPSPPTD